MGIIIGCSIGGFILVFCLPLTICIIIVCVVVVAAKRRESRCRSKAQHEEGVASTGYQAKLADGGTSPEEDGPVLQLEPV